MSLFRRRLMMDEHYQYIHFQDSETERICLENFDYDKDGRISLGDARNVETFGDKFNGSGIVYFNEYRFFVNERSWGTFRDCKNIKQVSLHPNCSNDRLFFGGYTNSIEKLDIPNGVKKLGNFSFLGALKAGIPITIPATVTSIEYGCFGWCSPKCFVFLGGQPPAVDLNWPYAMYAKCPAYVPDDAVEVYRRNASLMANMVTEVLPVSTYPG